MELHFVFVNQEKVYDRILREELCYCMRQWGLGEKLVSVVQDMCEDRDSGEYEVGVTSGFTVDYIKDRL